MERILNELFELHELKPREPFCVVGEQIDGSFELDHEVYLLEAKWTSDPCPEADLLVFRGKIEGKSKYGYDLTMSSIQSQKPVKTMAESSISPDALKQTMKEAPGETLSEQRDLFRGAFAEVLEDLGLVEALEEGRKSKPVSRETFLDILDGRS